MFFVLHGHGSLFGSNRLASAEVVRASAVGTSYNNRSRLLTQRDRRMLSTALGILLGSGGLWILYTSISTCHAMAKVHPVIRRSPQKSHGDLRYCRLSSIHSFLVRSALSKPPAVQWLPISRSYNYDACQPMKDPWTTLLDIPSMSLVTLALYDASYRFMMEGGLKLRHNSSSLHLRWSTPGKTCRH